MVNFRPEIESDMDDIIESHLPQPVAQPAGQAAQPEAALPAIIEPIPLVQRQSPERRNPLRQRNAPAYLNDFIKK